MGPVDALFLPHEVEVIKAIPISNNLPEDKQIWAWSTNGAFSIKNAYWVASQMSLAESTGSSSDGNQERSFRKRLWQINVPHKIRHFAWRACRDILPLKNNLVKRNVLQVDTCDRCNVEAKDSIHFLGNVLELENCGLHQSWFSPTCWTSLALLRRCCGA